MEHFEGKTNKKTNKQTNKQPNKQKKTRKPHPLVRLKNKIITHLMSWKKKTRHKKLEQTPIPL